MAFLNDLVGKRIAIKSKWGPVYVATLKSCDSFMNVRLDDCFEYSSGAKQQPGGDEPDALGEVLLRCNNVLYVRELPPKGDLPPLFA